jgi:chemotaxis methyl-accepting protein methylase
MPYLYKLPTSVSFRGKGLFGYSFGRMKQKDIEVLRVESESGHDTFMILRGVTRTYYVLSGNGSFTIDGHEYSVSPGVLIEVPPGVEYCYSGRMTMLAFCRTGWFHRRDKFTKWNRDVVGDLAPYPLNGGPWLQRLVRVRILGKSPTNAFLRFNNYVWDKLPSSVLRSGVLQSYGRFLHALVRIQHTRAQAHSTFFLRNRPELELIQRLVRGKNQGDTVRVAVLACSTGAEVYSIAWAIRTARPDLKLVIHAVDVSSDAVEQAQRGIYPLNAKVNLDSLRDCMAAGHWRVGEPGSGLIDSEIFERLTPAEKAEFFDIQGDLAVIKDCLKEGIEWGAADVRAPELRAQMGLHDIVVANNFLCHMERAEAEHCLRNIGQLVDARGVLFVSGVDLEIRQKVARDLGWQPVDELLEQIHDGDSCLRGQWPFQYAGLEPLTKHRSDWKMRYAAAFQVGASTKSGHNLQHGGTTLQEQVEPQSTTV